jgi:hypothetical protein
MGGFAGNQQVTMADGQEPTMLQLLAAQNDPRQGYAQPRGREFRIFTVSDTGIQVTSTAGTLQDGIITTGLVRGVKLLRQCAPIYAVQLFLQDPLYPRRGRLAPKHIYCTDTHIFAMIDGTFKTLRHLRKGMRLRPLTTDLLPGTSPNIMPLVQGPPRVLQASVSLPAITFVSATLIGMQPTYGMKVESSYSTGVIAVPLRDPRVLPWDGPESDNPNPDTHARGVFVYAS